MSIATAFSDHSGKTAPIAKRALFGTAAGSFFSSRETISLSSTHGTHRNPDVLTDCQILLVSSAADLSAIHLHFGGGLFVIRLVNVLLICCGETG